jgi:3,4-dihydroxy 2-butanone 4-phosphate synthase/GTP cyclohydrolase II
LQKEVSVERIGDHVVQTEFGQFRLVSYEDHVNRNVHLALVRGDLSAARLPLVRVHVQDTLGDVVGVEGSRQGWPLRDAMRRIAEAGNGALILLRYAETPRQLMNAVRALGQPISTDAQRRDGVAILRTFGTGAQILRDLGVTRMKVLSAPKQMHAISGFGLEVVEYVDNPT